MVNELAELYQVPKPRVYMIPSEQPNAFATGRNPKHAAVAVTQGLLQHMPYDQVRAVMAHEFAHIKNRDILVSSIAAMIAGAVSAIGNIFFFTAMFGGDDDDSPLGASRRDRADDHRAARRRAAAARRLAAARVPRRRDRRADASRGSSLWPTRSRPSRPPATSCPMPVNPATETLYIVNPFSAGGVTKLFSTHPPIADRVKRLREYDRAAGIHYG